MTDAPMTERVLRPQFATEARVAVNNPLWSFEPYWIGDRLLARVERGRVQLTDSSGLAVDEFYRDLAEVLAASVDADQAVIDGIWTAQPFLGAGSSAERWAEAIASRAETAGDAQEPMPDPAALETRRAFVVVDLLELDGQFLGDIPYQERRRLLAGIVREGIRLRVTPAVKVPLGSWFGAWQQNGFSRAVAKHVNSRYRPGEPTADWVIVDIHPDRPPGVVGLFWKGRRKRQITR